MKKFGHYEVTAELGRGGMGVVYQGWEPSLNRKVAIKALGEHLLGDKDLVERFTREAKATAALNDPNVIQIYFIGEEKGQPYFAMEYIKGESLDDILKGGNALSVAHAKNILKQACLGMTAAHKLDLVHRDIKPANLMLTTDGTLKVVDFGIARTREYGDKLTNTGEFVGTPGYLSPEVCIGKEVDQRSDIFSLGIVFYEMLAGKVPFENDSPLGLMLEVVQSDIPDIRALNKKVDKKTSFILNKMIAKSPDDRYQTCEEIARDLGNVVENQDLESIKSGKYKVNAAKVKNKTVEQITLANAAAITQNNTILASKQQGSKKWLIAATLMAAVGASGYAYVNGYMPFLNKSQVETNRLVAENSVIEQTTTKENLTALKPTFNANTPSTKIAVDVMLIEQDVAKVDVSDSVVLDVPSEDEPKTAGFVIEKMAQTAGVFEEIPEETLEEMQATEKPSSIVTTVAEKLNIEPPKNKVMLAVVEKTVQQLPTMQKTQIIQTIAKAVTQAPVEKAKPKPIKKTTMLLNKGVVVIAFGDPAVANPIEKVLESQLKSQGIKVFNEQFIPGMSQLLNNDLDLAQIKQLIQKNGGQAMVIANINYIGSEQLSFYGKTSELINAQLDIDAYDIKTGNSIGNGFGSKLSYTSLNATQEATSAALQYSDELSSDLRKKI